MKDGITYNLIPETKYENNEYTAAMIKVKLPEPLEYNAALNMIDLPRVEQTEDKDKSDIKFNEFLFEIAYKDNMIRTLGVTAYNLKDGNVTAISSCTYTYPYYNSLWTAPITNQSKAIASVLAR